MVEDVGYTLAEVCQ